ncbi:MAG: DUF3592 domain-containing protein [uncultured Aureispira sp.]|uniref:DUF3592 domain-containing protein n=1 Tax=uncultured Aureispira sp. TaxID=1331704 RepID=A0A6S6S958_9BACT|nr:MAG: DUF3592 domain-containing protein [uncultured Aureispira sp.]
MNKILNQDTFREVPPRHLNIFTQIQVLFGGFNVLFGSLFFWFGMVFVLIFVGQSDAIHWFSMDGEWKETEGLLLEINDGNGFVNDEPIYEYVFTYSANGQSFTGKSNGLFRGEEENTLIQIEYKAENPIRSRILGMRSEVFPGWVVFIVLIFPIMGLVFLILGLKENKKALSLLINGSFTRGKMLHYEATNTRINHQTVYAYKFEFQASNKMYTAECKTHLTDKIEDEETEKILYSKADPRLNLVYDAMGAAPKLDRYGKIEQANALALKVLIPTVLGLVVNALIFILLYL